MFQRFHISRSLVVVLSAMSVLNSIKFNNVHYVNSVIIKNKLKRNMCLMMGGGYERCCQPVCEPTPKGIEQRNRLVIIAFIHLAFAIMLFFISPQQGFQELIDVLILFCATAQMNYCCLIFYIFYVTINFFVAFNAIGLWLQTGNVGKQLESASFG